MKKKKSDSLIGSQILLYQTEDGRTRIDCRFENETIWLTQGQMAELFQTTIPNINLHLKSIYEEGELAEAATIKNYLIVRPEGRRQVTRDVLHYNLPAILAIGYRVRSHRGTPFRRVDIDFEAVVKQLPKTARSRKQNRKRKP